MFYIKLARTFGRGNNGAPVPTIIGENTKFMGDISSGGILHVDGNIEGNVSCEELIIGVKGSVNGVVRAQNMHLYGAIQGQAYVDSLFLSSTAKLIGDVTHNSIAIEPGAYIDGQCIRAKAQLTVTQDSTEQVEAAKIRAVK